MNTYFESLLDHFGHDNLCDHASNVGNLELMQWARQRGCPWTTETTSRATSIHSFHVLKWAVENGCPVNLEVAEICSLRGYFDILKWAHLKHLPFSSWVSIFAASNGRLDILKWLHDQNYEWNYVDGFYNAVLNNHWHVVEWMVRHGYVNLRPWYSSYKFDGRFMSVSFLLQHNVFSNRHEVQLWVDTINSALNDMCYDDLSYLIKIFI